MFYAKTVDQKFGFLGCVVMATFGAIAIWRWLQTDMLFFALFALRDFLAAGFMLRRHEAVQKCPPTQQFIAYLSSGMPLLYQPSMIPLSQGIAIAQSLMVIGGFTLVTLATIELGFQLGVSPANRGNKVGTGVYRYLTHPMYIGYLLAEFGLIFVNPINPILFVLSAGMYSYRAKSELIILTEKNKV